MADTLPHMQDAALAGMEGIRHGFFTRNGGVSEGLYATLNTGPGSNDSAANVQENRRRVAAHFNLPPQNLLSLNQIHSARVLTVEAPFAEGERPEGDAMVTATPNLALGILTADCAPVLLADPEARVIGACHAGWRGAYGDIMERTVEAMLALGATREHITAAVGPCIGKDSYEVDRTLYDGFMSKAMPAALYFTPKLGKSGHYQFDLGGYVRHMLDLCGIAQANLLAHDTCLEENAFFSNRRRNQRSEMDYGRQVSAIMLLP